MLYLILGLMVLLGVHSVRIVNDDWRTQALGRIGAVAWKTGFSVLSLVGLALVVWGFSLARLQPVQLWLPPPGLRHIGSLLTLIAFVLLVAAYVPGNLIKERIGHPMVLGVKFWALAHLLANGKVADVVLFGSILLWAVLDFVAARKREPLTAQAHTGGTAGATGITVALAVGAWVAVTLWLHGLFIGIRPFG